jgi:tetratricopeptide (TPR) repeat protein
MRYIQAAVLAVAIVAGGLASCSAVAGESNGTPAARAAFDEGETAARAGKLPDAAAAFRKAIDADPDFVDAHQRYIEITRRQEMPRSRTPTVPRLQELYEGWAREQPARAVYQWALGFLSPETDTADVFFKNAIAIDPAFARAYFELAKNADLRGNWTAQREYLKRAVESNPADPRYLMRYAIAQRQSEPARFRELALQVVSTFPTSPFAAEALYNLARAFPNPERRGYVDRLRADYPVDRFNYSAAAMSELYGELTNPSDALPLAREMAKALPANKTWPARVAFQEAMTRARALVTEKQYAAAVALIDGTPRPSGSHGMTWTLLEAEAAAGAGRVDQAYATLLDVAAAVPDARVEAALAKYGREFSKSPRDVDAELWRVRDTKATIAAPFELVLSRGGAPVKLADYRGQVVLLAFWFPG